MCSLSDALLSFHCPVAPPLDLKRLKVFPLSERKSLSCIEDILLDPDTAPLPCAEGVQRAVEQCARQILSARQRGASVLFLYGAHLVKNGAAAIVERLMSQQWLTHLATNGAGSIHDWEFAFQGWSTESVEQNVATGTFGTWDETGRGGRARASIGLPRPDITGHLGRARPSVSPCSSD